MRKHPFSKPLTHILAVMGFILTISTGLAFAATNSSENDASVLLKSLKATKSGYQVEIVADKPMTFTYYKTSNPYRAVIDLAQTNAGDIEKNNNVNEGIIKNINVSRHTFGTGFLTRVEIVLSTDDEFTVSQDPSDRGRLVVDFTKPNETVVAKADEKTPNDTTSATAEVQKTAPLPIDDPGLTAKKDIPTEQIHTASEVKKDSLTVSEQQIPIDKPKSSSTDITSIDLLKDSVEIKLTGKPDSYKSFTMNKPERLVLDLYGVKSALKTQTIDINSFGVGKVRIGVNPDKVRLVFDSSAGKIPGSEISEIATGIKIVFIPNETSKNMPANPVSAENKTTPVATAMEPIDKSVPTVKKPGIIEAIDFEVRGEYSQIKVTANGFCEPGKPVKNSKGLALTFKDCQVPRNLQRPIDSSSFQSVVKGITPLNMKRKKAVDAKLLVQLRGDAPSKITKNGFTYLWEIKNTVIPSKNNSKQMPEIVSGVNAKSNSGSLERDIQGTAEAEIPIDQNSTIFKRSDLEKKKYTGRRVSLEFSDAEVRRIFQLIAEVSSLNFLIADDVSGTISIKLVNVPWDQALDVILESKNLEMKREGNIIQIKPKGKFKTVQIEEQEARRAQERAMPLITEIFEINFADIGEIQSQFERIRTERGVINKDLRTNRVIVKDVQPAIEEMRFLLKNVDMPERQVLIEARIVEASSTFTRDLGVQWGFHYTDADAPIMGVRAFDAGWGGVVGIRPPQVGVNDSAGAALGVSFGKLDSNIKLDLRLSAAASAGLVKIVSSPKVVTLNNKQARISQGQALYLPSSSAEGTKQDKIDATLSLEVTPHITPDGTILMKVKATNDSPGVPPPGATASVNKKEANTELLVKNGETTVIGGIYVDSDTESDSGVPYLMDIPLLGWLFKSNSKQKTKTELLIFITPRIVN